MRKGMIKQALLATAIFAIMTNVYAVAPGFYMGLSTGPATNGGGTEQVQAESNGSGVTTTTPATPSSSQWGTRVYIGNKFGKYASVEGGLDYVPGIEYNTKNVQTCSGASVRVRAFDVMGKGEFGLGSFSAFGKAGAAIVYQSASGAFNPGDNGTCGKSTYTNQIKPVFAAGVSYDLSQNWVADLSWTRLMTGGIPGNVDMFGLGISYHFVDVYCGQFLCN